MPDDEDVQNGITVFPVKSLASTNVSTGHAAIPHQKKRKNETRRKEVYALTCEFFYKVI